MKKVLYVGVFALILNNFQFLADIIFTSFAQLGLNATGTTITAGDLLRPGFVANTGFSAAHPLLQEISDLTGPIGFFVNIVMIVILFLAWLITLFAFFFLAIQLFVTIIEFKLTTLAGFVLVPFALWNKTSFLAERVLGNVIASGVKLMVLAIIVGIGSTLFSSVTAGFTPGSVTLEQAGSVILASMALFALGIFGPGIAAGLVSGAPQLGAGAAVGAAAGVGAGVMGWSRRCNGRRIRCGWRQHGRDEIRRSDQRRNPHGLFHGQGRIRVWRRQGRRRWHWRCRLGENGLGACFPLAHERTGAPKLSERRAQRRYFNGRHNIRRRASRHHFRFKQCARLGAARQGRSHEPSCKHGGDAGPARWRSRRRWREPITQTG